MLQEMLEYVQNMPTHTNDTQAENNGEVNAIYISVATLGYYACSFHNEIENSVTRHNLTFLLDYGSPHSFLDCAVPAKLKGISSMPASMVKVANGGLVPCTQQLLSGSWSMDGHSFLNDLKSFPWALIMAFWS